MPGIKPRSVLCKANLPVELLLQLPICSYLSLYKPGSTLPIKLIFSGPWGQSFSLAVEYFCVLSSEGCGELAQSHSLFLLHFLPVPIALLEITIEVDWAGLGWGGGTTFLPAGVLNPGVVHRRWCWGEGGGGVDVADDAQCLLQSLVHAQHLVTLLDLLSRLLHQCVLVL